MTESKCYVKKSTLPKRNTGVGHSLEYMNGKVIQKTMNKNCMTILNKY